MIPVLLPGATLIVGIAALRRTRNAADFFVAGRRPGAFLAGLAVAATFRPPAPEGLAAPRLAAPESSPQSSRK